MASTFISGDPDPSAPANLVNIDDTQHYSPSAKVTPSTTASKDSLPQPQNSNHISSAPLKEKLLTNSSYLAAEIPLKFGHFMNHLWMSGSELLSDTSGPTSAASQELWLLGCRYEMPDHIGTKMQNDMLEAQKDNVFRTSATPLTSTTTEPATTSATCPESTSMATTTTTTTLEPAVMSVLWPPDFYLDFTTRFWMTYRHNYPPIRPSHYKTDIGWGCMLRSGQSLLANALMIHFLSRQWRRTDPSDPTWNTYSKVRE